MKTISFIVCYIVTFYRLILLIDIFICLVVTAVCLFFIKVLHLRYRQEYGTVALELEYRQQYYMV